MKRVCTQCGREEGDSVEIKGVIRETEFSPRSSWCKNCRNIWMGNRKLFLKEKGIKYMNPKRVKWNDEEKLLSKDEWESIWPHIKDPDILLAFDIMQSSGLRVHELLYLRMKDFDFRKGIAKVNTLKQKEKRPEGHTIPMRPDILSEIQRRDKDPLFSIGYDALYDEFKRIGKKVGINPRLALHSFRHLCAMRLNKAGGSTLQIARMLRHAYGTGGREAVTLGYLHTNLDELKDLARRSWKEQIWLWDNYKITNLYWGTIEDRQNIPYKGQNTIVWKEHKGIMFFKGKVEGREGIAGMTNSFDEAKFHAKRLGTKFNRELMVVKITPSVGVSVIDPGTEPDQYKWDSCDAFVYKGSGAHNGKTYNLLSPEKFNFEVLENINFEYSNSMWNFCTDVYGKKEGIY